MNKDRRKRIEEVEGTLREAIEELSQLRDEEQEAYDNLPDGLKESTRGEAMELAADFLDTAVSNIELELGNLESARGE